MRRRSALAVVLSLAAAGPATATPLPHPDAGPRRYNPAVLAEREALTEVLRTKVAYVQVKFRPKSDAIASDDERDGFGVVIGPRRVACLSWIVDRAEKVWITGPKKIRVAAKVILYDIDRRVALLESEVPLSRTGLSPAQPALAPERSYDQTVYAILSTGDNPFLANGVLTEAGETPELEGLLRSDLKLVNGMPIFDELARFVGYSRSVAWDADQFMVVTPEFIAAAQTATTTAASKPKAGRDPKDPWYKRPRRPRAP